MGDTRAQQPKARFSAHPTSSSNLLFGSPLEGGLISPSNWSERINLPASTYSLYSLQKQHTAESRIQDTEFKSKTRFIPG